MLIPDNMNPLERIAAPTPRYFQKIRNIGLALVAVAGAITAAPVVLPAVVVSVAGYAGLAGMVMSAVAQSAVKAD